MENSNECKVEIHIKNETIKVNCKINQKYIPIKLNLNDINNEYKLNILFLENEYQICLEKHEENTISDIMNNLTTNKTYEIQFQNKQYKLNLKQILIIIIDKFIQIIKKEYIIEG